MSKQNVEKAMYEELKVLNDVIDRKIIRGLSYVREARRHKVLLANLAGLRRASKNHVGWFSRSLGLVSTFLL